MTVPSQLEAEGPVATVEIDRPPNVVFDVLVDPTTYPRWLVGADSIRAVDADWPKPGTSFHHVVGVGPAKLADHSSVISLDRPRRLELDVFARPFLRARVVFTLAERPGGGTVIELRERPHQGLVGLLWGCVGRVGVAAGIWGRNVVSLDRLRRYLTEGSDGSAA